MSKYLLFTPGPVNVAENIRQAITKEDICHREVDFDVLLQSIERKLLSLFQIQDKSKYRAVVITGSGTAANESILSSVVGDKKILILSNGEFGERLFNISTIHNKNTFLLKFPWGEPLDLNKIQGYLERSTVDIVMMVHHETSSGILNSLEKVGALANAHGASFIVDCVSSAGAEQIDMEKHNISFCSSSSSKAVASYAGLSFIIGKTKEFEKLNKLPVKTAYLNLYKFYHFIKTISQTPNTPAVPLYYALEQALINILNDGVANHHASLKNKANFLRKGMRALGLRFLIDEQDMSSVLTTVHCPNEISVKNLQVALRKYNIMIYEGKGCFKNKVFQVGNIGDMTLKDMQFFLLTLKNIFTGLKPIRIKVIPDIESAELVLALTKPGNKNLLSTRLVT